MDTFIIWVLVLWLPAGFAGALIGFYHDNREMRVPYKVKDFIYMALSGHVTLILVMGVLIGEMFPLVLKGINSLSKLLNKEFTINRNRRKTPE